VTTPVLSFEGIRKSYGQTQALRGVSFHVNGGEIFGLLGPNGAGKTTTIKMLITLLIPTAGTARVLGIDVVKNAHEVRKRIGYVFGGDRGVYERLSGYDNLRYFAELYGVPPAEQKRRIEELLELVGLRGREHERAEGYSRGMKQRLHVARGLLHDPEVIFLDEPTIGLDLLAKQRFRDLLVRLNNEQGTTIFLTTQYLEEADVLADRVGIIDHGHIVAEGTPAALKAEVGRPTVEAIPASEDDLPRTAGILERFGEPVSSTKGVAVRLNDGRVGLYEIVRALDADGLEAENIQIHQPSLDDVFLAKTGRSLEGAAEEDEEEQRRGLAMEPA